MGLFKLYSSNVEIQYKSYFLSKATLFICITTILNVTLPLIIAYQSRGFWLKSHFFYEQPAVEFTYGYLLVAETDDSSKPIVCSEIEMLSDDDIVDAERCSEIQVQQHDINGDNKNDLLEISFHLDIPPDKSIHSMILILEFDYQLKTVCPLHMQTLGVITKDFSLPSSSLLYYGDLELYQISHLPCLWHHTDTTYNNSLLKGTKENNENIVDFILAEYFRREVNTKVRTLYSRSQNEYTGSMTIKINLRVPEMKIRYVPSLFQELRWAWPQFLSIVIIFYWFFNKVKRFVFNNRLLMVWQVIPWKKSL